MLTWCYDILLPTLEKIPAINFFPYNKAQIYMLLVGEDCG